jgi:hypothetical protein
LTKRRRSTVGFRGAASVALAIILSGSIPASVWGQEPKDDATGPVGAAASGPEGVVQQQVEAYNRHDIEAFLKSYSAEIKVFDFPDTLRFSGLETMRERYGKLFKGEPGLKVKIARRIVQGDHVIDHEEVKKGGDRPFTVVAVYRVEGGRITAVWFLR